MTLNNNNHKLGGHCHRS